MHNGGVSYQASSFTSYTKAAIELWHSQFNKIEVRGLRKVLLATMFTTIALVYIDQLAMWGIFTIIAPGGAHFATTPLSTLVAASIGAVYLWRVGIAHPIEMTIVAIIATSLIQKPLIPIVYSIDFATGEFWFVFAYIMFFIALSIAYTLSYIFFVSLRMQYRDKIVIAVAFVSITLAILATIKSEI